jgi:large repetitive protein
MKKSTTMFNNIIRPIVLIISLFTLENAFSQNEAFHGGQGDGSNYSSNTFSFSSVGFEGNNLNVTVNQSAGQSDPTNSAPVSFTVVFSEAVTDFDETDVQVTGTAAPQNIVVTGSGTNYQVELSGMSANGKVIVQIPSGSAHNSVGNPNLSSSSTDNSVIYTGLNLSAEINLALNQAILTNSNEVHFSVEFSEEVADFTSDDIQLSGTANASNINLSGAGASYDVAVSGMTGDGTVIINIPANRVHNNFGAGNQASVNTQNSVTCDFISPGAEITLADGQTSPSPSSVLEFLVTFSEKIEGFESSDVQITGTAQASNAVITNNGNNTYLVAVSGMSQEGTVIITIDENSVNDIAGNGNTASINTENEIIYTNILFIVTISQATSQSDPTNEDVAVFDIYFNREPADFDVTDILVSGNTSANVVDLNGSGTDYQLSLSGFSADGTVAIAIEAGTIHDQYGNVNQETQINDNEVTIDKTQPQVEITLPFNQNNPSNSSVLVFRALFSEEVINFDAEDVQVSGSTGANIVNVDGSGNEYFIEVQGMNSDGNVIISIPSNKCTDMAGNLNSSSQDVENKIVYDITHPGVEIKQAPNQQDPTTELPLRFIVEFTENVKQFDASKIVYGGSPGTTLRVSGYGLSYTVEVAGLQNQQTFSISIPEGMIYDLAGNYNYASINTDNSITYTGSGTTGINDLDNSENCSITYFNDQVHIDFEEFPELGSEVKIYSIDGKLLYTNNRLEKQNIYSLNKKNALLIVNVKNGNKNSRKLIATY